MGERTAIEWTDHTWSPWWGCVEVSPACDHCYARVLAHRLGFSVWGKDTPRRELSEVHWHQPYKWQRAAELEGVRRRVFPSMCDPFEFRGQDEKASGQIGRLRGDFFCLIEGTPSLDWLLLTKRPQNVRRMVPDRWHCGAPGNVWIGATIEDRAHLWRLDQLRRVAARVRFLSIEPLLEDLGPLDLAGIDWVIVGGESGPKARPMRPDWVRSIRDQCAVAGVPFFFKQWGEWGPFGQAGVGMNNALIKIGKKAAGRDLDGREWSDLPKVATK